MATRIANALRPRASVRSPPSVVANPSRSAAISSRDFAHADWRHLLPRRRSAYRREVLLNERHVHPGVILLPLDRTAVDVASIACRRSPNATISSSNLGKSAVSGTCVTIP